MNFGVHSQRSWFLPACLFELGLLAAAQGFGALLNLKVAQQVRWNWKDAAAGTLAALPLLALFWLLLGSRLKPLVQIRQFLDDVVRPVFGRWPLWQLGVISLAAGVGEEMLFRGVVQGGLSRWLGTAWGLALASALFGLAHVVNWAYAIAAALIGAYLGTVWLLTGNLLAPILTHALYDFCALVYFLRAQMSPGRDLTTDNQQ
jgi:hypothetical protein